MYLYKSTRCHVYRRTRKRDSRMSIKCTEMRRLRADWSGPSPFLVRAHNEVAGTRLRPACHYTICFVRTPNVFVLLPLCHEQKQPSGSRLSFACAVHYASPHECCCGFQVAPHRVDAFHRGRAGYHTRAQKPTRPFLCRCCSTASRTTLATCYYTTLHAMSLGEGRALAREPHIP